MSEITLIFPHQLFQSHPAIKKGRPVLLVEDELFFRQYRFHKKKLMLHRASMKAYEHELVEKGYSVQYLDTLSFPTLDVVFDYLLKLQVSKVYIASVTDYLLERRLNRYSRTKGMVLHVYDSPGFICTEKYLADFFQNRHYFLNQFYIEQRKRFGILLTDGKPFGAKWNFDSDNRKKLPSKVVIPSQPEFSQDPYVYEAAQYASENFASNYGDTNGFIYPVTRKQALSALKTFLTERFTNYGPYQDAIVSQNSYLFHSVLSPALNIGLLTPVEVLNDAINYWKEHNAPINSIEGFIRQILGWREYVRALYILEGVKQRKSNHWNHQRQLPSTFWTGNTGILPVDNVIHKVIKSAYSNHIERLMVMGNFMMLCGIDPNDAYRWFMELYVDAYDWVMVPNVYGMSQFADGGIMSTKPYISGSNYLKKMSNFRDGRWNDIWDSLYWHFINKHSKSFSDNPRMMMMVKQLKRIPNQELIRKQLVAEKFLQSMSS